MHNAEFMQYQGRTPYIGAGSYVTAPSIVQRLNRHCRYLINCAESELFGKSEIYMSSMETIIGSRPRSIDARPLIGAFKEYPNLLVATEQIVGLTGLRQLLSIS